MSEYGPQYGLTGLLGGTLFGLSQIPAPPQFPRDPLYDAQRQAALQQMAYMARAQQQAQCNVTPRCDLCGFDHEKGDCRPSAMYADHLPYETTA